MINWDEFEHIHVIKKLKFILSSWWNVDVIFTDEQGQIRNLKQSSLLNPAVRAFMEKETNREGLSEEVSKIISQLESSEKRFDLGKWPQTGLDMCIFPILIDREFMGTVVAIGFIKDTEEAHRIKEVKDRLRAQGETEEHIDGGDQENSFL